MYYVTTVVHVCMTFVCIFISQTWIQTLYSDNENNFVFNRTMNADDLVIMSPPVDGRTKQISVIFNY